MDNREIIACAQCRYAGIVYECGFNGRRYLVCSDRGYKEVSDDDGCTMGELGEQPTMKADVDVDIGAWVAANGWRYEQG